MEKNYLQIQNYFLNVTFTKVCYFNSSSVVTELALILQFFGKTDLACHEEKSLPGYKRNKEWESIVVCCSA